MKISLLLSFVLTIAVSTSAFEEGGGFTDTACQPLPSG